jgi:hypothetical protein
MCLSLDARKFPTPQLMILASDITLCVAFHFASFKETVCGRLGATFLDQLKLSQGCD